MSVDIPLPMPAFRIGTTEITMPAYNIYESSIGQMCRVARVSVECAGQQTPQRYWALMPCSEFGTPMPHMGEPRMLIGLSHLRTREEVDQSLCRGSHLRLIKSVPL